MEKETPYSSHAVLFVYDISNIHNDLDGRNGDVDHSITTSNHLTPRLYIYCCNVLIFFIETHPARVTGRQLGAALFAI